MRKRVIITGGTGFIGKALCRELAAGGHEVLVLSRNPGASPVPPGLPVKVVRWDGTSDGEWSGIIEGAHAVVNLAGENLAAGRWTESVRRNIRRSRVDAGRAVCGAVRRARRRPRVLVQASAVGFYGPRAEEGIDESGQAGTGFLSAVAREWEASTAEVESLGVRRVVIRSGVVLGEGGGMLSRVIFPFRLFFGGVPGSGDAWVSWIHLSDEVRAIRFLIEREDARGAFNLTAPCPARSRDFYRAVGRALNRPVWVPIPAFGMRLLYGGMADEVILAGQRAVPKRLAEMGFEYGFADLAGALGDVLRPRP